MAGVQTSAEKCKTPNWRLFKIDEDTDSNHSTQKILPQQEVGGRAEFVCFWVRPTSDLPVGLVAD